MPYKSRPAIHYGKTAALARQLRPREVYDWLQTAGFYPESYVLPPCFAVITHRPFGKVLVTHTKRRYSPPVRELLAMQFPKSDWTDRTFGIIDPNIHTDMALLVARNWKSVTRTLFPLKNLVFSYSFPIPVDRRSPGAVGALRAGRMIYEWVEMAERDLAAEAYRYRCLFTADVKNCYASIYTHSIAWALHGKRAARRRRNDFDLVGNRLDKLFQNANDGCTNGIPVGPAISDLVAELVFAGVDQELSKGITKLGLDANVLVVRFKDDYRVLAKNAEDGRTTLKLLQSALRDYRLELNEEKTESRLLPDGIFRPWVSLYHAANPSPRRAYGYRRFREVYLAVVSIDRAYPGTGIIDRFLADLVRRNGTLRLTLRTRELDQAVSLLLMLPALRSKCLPKVLAIVEAVLKANLGAARNSVGAHVAEWYEELLKREAENVYQLTWLAYFMRANRLPHLTTTKPKDLFARAARTSRFPALAASGQAVLFRGVRAASQVGSMLDHLELFDRTP